MKRLVPFIVLIFAVMAGLASIPFLLKPEDQQAKIAASLSTLLQRPVALGKLSYGYWPPSVQIENLSATTQEGAPFLQVKNVSAPLSLLDLLKLKIIPQGLEISDWSLTINRKSDGSWDAQEWWPKNAGLGESKSRALRRIGWKKGAIRWVDAHSSAPQEVGLSLVEGHWEPRPEVLNLNGTFIGASAGVGLSFTAQGQFFRNAQWTGDLQLTAQGQAFTAHITRTPTATDIRAQAVQWPLASAVAWLHFIARIPPGTPLQAPLSIDNWQLHVKKENAQITFEHAATVGGGQTELKGAVMPNAAGPVARFDAAVESVPAEALLAVAGLAVPISGKVTGVTKDFQLSVSSQIAKSMSGLAYIEAKEGIYLPPEASLKRLAKAKTTAYLKKAYPDLSTKGLPFSRLSAHLLARNGMIIVDDGLLVTPSLRSAWVGHVDAVRHGLDGYVRIDFREKNAKLKGSIPLKYQAQPAFGRLQGSWEEWSARSLPSTKVGAANQSKLKRAITQK